MPGGPPGGAERSRTASPEILAAFRARSDEVVGQPYRLRHLRRALGHICKHRDKLWIATGGEIASYFAESAPIKDARAKDGTGVRR